MRKFINSNLRHYSTKLFNTSQVLPEYGKNKTSLILTVQDKPGTLLEALKIIAKHNLNISYVASKPPKLTTSNKKIIDFFIDIDGNSSNPNVINSFKDLSAMSENIIITKPEEVHWFPKSWSEFDLIGRKTLDAGKELTSDHPGFNDPVYRQRRQKFVEISNSFKMNDKDLPFAEYTQEENEIWEKVYTTVKPLMKENACQEFVESFEEMEANGIFTPKHIPQMDDVCKYLFKKCNFFYRPVGGLLSQREFLNGLGFRIFPCTQYIRHNKAPFYTPEPDIIHEYLGHAPLFCNKDFCDFSQEIGLASLGATDEEIALLGNIYWFSVEFGLCLQDGKRKIYGGGILSSPSEIKWAMSDQPQIKPFDLMKMATQEYSITDIQKVYFISESFNSMKEKILKFSENLKRPFNLTYNTDSRTITLDRELFFKV